MKTIDTKVHPLHTNQGWCFVGPSCQALSLTTFQMFQWWDMCRRLIQLHPEDLYTGSHGVNLGWHRHFSILAESSSLCLYTNWFVLQLYYLA